MWNFIVIFVFIMQCQCICYQEWSLCFTSFYFKLYCVILDKLSVFSTFLSNKKKQKKKKTNSLDMLAVLHLIVTVLSDRPSFEGGCNVTGQPIWFCLLKLTCSTCFHVVVAQHGVDGMLSGGSGGGNYNYSRYCN